MSDASDQLPDDPFVHWMACSITENASESNGADDGCTHTVGYELAG